MTVRETRSTILELAIAVIDEHGEQAIRTNHLAAEAGTTPPTLYHYFGSREGLVEEAQAERFFRNLVLDVDILIAQLAATSTEKQLRKAINDLFLRRDSHDRIAVRWKRLNALGAAYAREGLERRITEMHNEVVTKMALALMPFQRQGFIRQDIDLRAVIAWYNGAVLGKALVTMDGSDIDAGQWERTMNEAVLFTLFGPDSVQ